MDSLSQLRQIVLRNCDISDAGHCGMYSICTLVLKLRTLFKWEHALEPWDEPEPAEVLAWIEKKEDTWEEIGQSPYEPLPVNGGMIEPFAAEAVNPDLRSKGLFYGAGYGRSMKPVFFLAEIIRENEKEGWPVAVLGRELARELASPFAMSQGSQIVIRRESFRFFLYERIREIGSAGKEALHHSLSLYGVADRNGSISADRLRERLDAMVDGELEAFIHHELGEVRRSEEDREITRKLTLFFPGSAAEYVARSVQDVLADTDELGMLGYILRERKETSLGLYIALLDGMRQTLFPEIGQAGKDFFRTGDWEAIGRAVAAGRQRNLERARLIRELCRDLQPEDRDRLAADFEAKLLRPLGIHREKKNG